MSQKGRISQFSGNTVRAEKRRQLISMERTGNPPLTTEQGGIAVGWGEGKSKGQASMSLASAELKALQSLLQRKPELSKIPW